MLKRFVLGLATCGLVIATAIPAWSQAKKADPADKKPTTEAKPDEKPEEKPAEPKGPAAEKFSATYEKWKELLKQLRSTRTKYQAAEPEEQTGLKKQWEDLIAQADKMVPTLRADAVAAYEEAPNLDSSISRFLVKILADEVERDDYEAAAPLADTLIKNGCEMKQIYRYAGIIAFVNNDYDNAEKYFKEALDAKAINPGDPKDQAGQFYSLLAEYKNDHWPKEKELREAEAKADDLPRVKLETTKGDIVIELFENEAPQTVGNFVSLVEKKFYDGTVFHRVLPNFMAQGGDPEGTGTGGPGYNIYCECYEKNHRKHFRGTLSMAHAGKDTGGSQFFLTFVPTAHLNGRHTAFGRVIEGLDVLAKLQRVDPSDPAQKSIKPDKIVKAEVIRKRDHEYKPTKVE
jgi:cyclophilin family peptidyl-prolyl cis-trans isomerase